MVTMAGRRSRCMFDRAGANRDVDEGLEQTLDNIQRLVEERGTARPRSLPLPAASAQVEAIEPQVEQLTRPQHVHLRIVDRPAAIDHGEHVGKWAAQGDGRLLVVVPPGRAVGTGLDEPLGRQVGIGVGGVQVRFAAEPCSRSIAGPWSGRGLATFSSSSSMASTASCGSMV